MPAISIVFGLLLIGLGVGSYLMTDRSSMTALIPAFAGIVLALLGVIGRNPGARKHAMHAAAAIAVLGFAGSVPGVIKLVQMYSSGVKPLTVEERAAANLAANEEQLNNGKTVRPTAAKAQTAMAAILLPYIVLCVKSFGDARRARRNV